MKDIQDLSKDLQKWEKKITNNLIKAQDETADDILSELKMNINFQSGQLAESIERTDTSLIDGIIETEIGSGLEVVSSNGNRYYLAELMEYGTAPHVIYPVNSKYLQFEIQGKKIFARKVNHPGTVAYNNFANAFNNNSINYRNRLQNAIKEAFDEN